METKQFLPDSAEACEFSATIATLNVVDADGDVLLPGAFGDLDGVPVLPAHDQGHHPIGKASVTEEGDRVVARGEFNVDTQAGADWCAATKFDLDPAFGPPAGEWSWGFLPTEWHMGEQDGQRVRFIERVDLLEVSPVLRGASVGTGTQCAGECGGKSAKGAECSCGCDGPSEDELVEQWGQEMARRQRRHLAKQRRNQPSELATRGITGLGGEPREPSWRYKALPAEEWMERAVVEAADRLRIDAPAVFQMRQCQGDEKADLATDQSIDGASMSYGDEGHAVFIREALPLRLQMEYLGHELKHVEMAVKGRRPRTHDAVEFEADRYGFRFAEALAAAAPMPPQ